MIIVEYSDYSRFLSILTWSYTMSRHLIIVTMSRQLYIVDEFCESSKNLRFVCSRHQCSCMPAICLLERVQRFFVVKLQNWSNAAACLRLVCLSASYRSRMQIVLPGHRVQTRRTPRWYTVRNCKHESVPVACVAHTWQTSTRSAASSGVPSS